MCLCVCVVGWRTWELVGSNYISNVNVKVMMSDKFFLCVSSLLDLKGVEHTQICCGVRKKG